jgi:hypothetical protein
MTDDGWMPWVLGALLFAVLFMLFFVPPETLDVRPDTQDPVAEAGLDVTVPLGESVVLDGSGSSDDKGIRSYEWRIEDGIDVTFLRGERVTFVFTTPGQHQVTLIVTDHADKENYDELIVTVVA